MCFGAIHWAKIDTIVYGTTIEDVQKLGFNELTVSNAVLKELGNSRVTIISGFCRDECLKLLSDWNSLENKSLY